MKYMVVRGLFQFLLKLLPAVKFFDYLAVASNVTRGTDGKGFCAYTVLGSFLHKVHSPMCYL